MKALVSGATGLVGKELVKLLLEDTTFEEVTVYVRGPFPIVHSKLKVVTGQLHELSSRRDDLRADVYFSCLGTTIKKAGSQENFRKVDFHGVIAFGRVAAAHKSKKLIVVSASGANSLSGIFYSRVKGETEKSLKDLSLSSLVIFRPGLLVGDREEKRPGEKIGIESFRFLSKLIPEKISKKLGTDVHQLAVRMISEARSSSTGLQIIESQDI